MGKTAKNMSTTELRKKVQKQIETADELLLREILAMMKEHKKSQEPYEVSDEMINMLNERRERYKSGQSKGYTWEEVKAGLKKKK